MENEIDLAIFDGGVKIMCEIDCKKDAMVELIGPNGAKVSSGECETFNAHSFAIMDNIEINESVAFGEYKCKYKDRIIQERASSWVYYYRTCNKVERRGILQPNPKRLYVVDFNDRSCHMVRSCGDRQHIDRLVCPANEKSMCHVALNAQKYNTALMSQKSIQSCTSRMSDWYLSYLGAPIVLNSILHAHKEIRNVKIHCPAGGRTLACSVDGESSQPACSGTVDIPIPDGFFTSTGVKHFRCDSFDGKVYASLVYVVPGQNLTCAELEDGLIKCDFQPQLSPELQVKKSIKCYSDESISQSLNDFVVPSLDQCDEYIIVAEAYYEQPGTHETFRLPVMESGPFRKKPMQTESQPKSSTTDDEMQIDATQPSPKTTATPCHCNSANLMDLGSGWYIGVSRWLVLRAMIMLKML